MRPDADTVDHVHFVAFGEMDHDRRDATEADELALQHIDRQAGRDAGIDRVAAGFQDLEAGERGVVMAGHHHMVLRHDIGSACARGPER